MTRNGRLTVLALILALFLAPGLQFASAGDPQPPGSGDKMDTLQKQIKNLSASLDKKFDDLNQSLIKSMDDISKRWEIIDKNFENIGKDMVKLKNGKALQDVQIQLLIDQFKALDVEMAALKVQMATIKSKSMYQPLDMGEVKAKLELLEKSLTQMQNGKPYTANYPGTCNVSLINKTNQEATFVLNGQSYVVPANSTRTEVMSPGMATYQVYYPGFYGAIGGKTIELKANATHTITVG